MPMMFDKEDLDNIIRMVKIVESEGGRSSYLRLLQAVAEKDDDEMSDYINERLAELVIDE